MRPAMAKENEAEPVTAECLFCHFDDASVNDVLFEGREIYVRWDNFPAAKGHVEVVPKRHVESYFSLTASEHAEVYALIKRAWHEIEEQFQPDGCTIGVNEGQAAGRTIDHLHIHLIPRYEGDVPDPRGGIRHVLPGTNPDEWLA